MSDILDLMTNIVRAQAEGVKAGMHLHQERVDALLAAYDRAMMDASARLPTYLHAAIERFRDFRGTSESASDKS